jgi:hypothetical protein
MKQLRNSYCVDVIRSPADILRATERPFLHPRLRAFSQDYFIDNALRYLNAKARLTMLALMSLARER